MSDTAAVQPAAGISSPLLRMQLESACAELGKSSTVTPEAYHDLMQSLERILVAAKLEALAEFAAGAGHEINNPVATIVGRVQLLLSDEHDPNKIQALQVIGGQALRIRDMIGDTMLFARPPQPHPEFLTLLQLGHEAKESQADICRQCCAQVELDIPADLQIWADRTQLLIVLSSLIRNSVENCRSNGVRIIISAATEQRADGAWVRICVSDNGAGLDVQSYDHLFDPFYSGRQAGRGLGFGLSKCWRIIQLHGGTIEARDAPQLVQFEICLPVPARSCLY